ncbi:MAG TPA: HAD-IC family P-type ATPase, partial [Candidatus Dormibacteraeota bacterium]
LGAIAHADPNPNPSIRAIASGHTAPPGWRLESRVPFSSSRKWSAGRFADRGWWVLGAPDVLLAGTRGFELVADRVDRISAEGRRVILLARADLDAATKVIRSLEPAALVVLHEAIKPGAAETVRLLLQQGITIKLLSGDHPATVAAIAARVGLSTSGDPIDGKAMQESGPDLLALVRHASFFGRVSPEQKRDIVRALRAADHTVAMVGDGVNDVLAMKEADLGIAMGGGSAAARAVAACVLIDGSFAGVPAVLAEGRRVIGNVERLASLFFTKTTYAFLLALSVSLATLPFPFLPRQLTLISAFTIGIPSVYLALAPSFEPSRSGFVRRVMRFAVPAGAVAAVATFAAYALAVNEPNVSISEERTVATVVIAAIGLWILARLAQPLTASRRGLIAAMAAGLAIVMLLAPVRLVFDLDFPRPIVAISAVGIIALAFLSLELGDQAIAFVGRYWGAEPN